VDRVPRHTRRSDGRPSSRRRAAWARKAAMASGDIVGIMASRSVR
jgi:hypothetical protein